MQPKKDKPKKRFLTRSTTAQKIILVVILILILANDLFLFGGNIHFYAKWAQCRQKPVSGVLSSRRTWGGVPNYYDSPSVALFRIQSGYYCTPLEAERAGYSSNPDMYEFENLPRGQWQEAIGKSKNL